MPPGAGAGPLQQTGQGQRRTALMQLARHTAAPGRREGEGGVQCGECSVKDAGCQLWPPQQTRRSGTAADSTEVAWLPCSSPWKDLEGRVDLRARGLEFWAGGFRKLWPGADVLIWSINGYKQVHGGSGGGCRGGCDAGLL